ncbi:MAG: terminase small subunit [bacterium]|nr:terminase small subunit [bacterium]
MAKLTDKQQKFINEYLVDLNATQAAIRAGYSKKTAQRMGSENLSKQVIQKVLQKQRVILAKKNDITVERVLQEEKCLAFIDPITVFELKEGTDKSPADLPENIRRAIAGIDKTISGKDGKTTYKYKFWDKGKSLERISKHLGLYEKDNNQQGNVVNIFPDCKVDKGKGLKNIDKKGQ